MSDSVLGVFSLVFGMLLFNHLITAQTASSTKPDLFPYGSDVGDSQVSLGSFSALHSPPLTLTTPFTFFGKQYTDIVVNYNGVLSLGTESFTEYYARPFPFQSLPLIAPFWDDIDFLLWNGLYYRQTNDSDLLQYFYNYTLLLNKGDSKSDDYYPTHLFIATWDEAPHFVFYFLFGIQTQPFNTFQVVLGTNGTTTIAVFLYKDIQWGIRAQIGVNAGDGYSSFSLSEAVADPVEDVDNRTNVGLPGVFVFRIDNLGLVECFEVLECKNSTKSLGMMTAPECCIKDSSGLAYTKPGFEECHICIVFGWFQDSYTGVEQEIDHIIMAGYKKGSQTVGDNLVFTVNERYQRDSSDILVVTSEVRFSFENPQPSMVNISFLIDDIAQEHNETVTLVLVPLPTTNLPQGEGVFFINTTDMIIIDTDVLDISFSLEEYTATEADEQMIISVCKDKRTSGYSTVRLMAGTLTVDNDNQFNEGLPIPAADPDSLSTAASVQDFDNETLTLGFYGTVNCRRTSIHINNDDINEAKEVFSIRLMLDYSRNPNLITLSRNVSLGIIIDDDPIRIGFVKENYTFIEPPTVKSFSIPLVKEGGRVSEQTFDLQIEVTNMTTRFQSATFDDDFKYKIVNIRMHPNQQTVMWEFELIPDDLPEENEAFHVSISYPKFRSGNQDVFNATTIIINDPQSLVGFIQDVYTVREDAGFMNLSIFVFNSSVDVVVNFTTLEQSATKGKDYEQISRIITIIGNDTTVISVPVINDDVAEGLEMFDGRLEIISPVNNSTASIISIEIIDDEATGVCGNNVPSLKSNCSVNALCEVSSNGRELVNCSCKVGYLGTGPICHNIDECEIGKHSCHVNADCLDTQGSYECHCKDGFFGNGTLCINNTDKLPDYCDQDSANCTCFNFSSNGLSVECGCSYGYKVANESDSFSLCQDVDECKDHGANPCHNGMCNNTDGSYDCFCPPGYILDSSGIRCVDLDECTLGLDDCSKNADCSNSDGGFNCSCKRNYFGDGKLCFSTKECNETCSQTCIVTSNSSFCGCQRGHYLSSDLRTCEDIDECILKMSNCDKNAECMNTKGSYKCLCKAGFQGNGEICKDIDECVTGFHNCDENANCSNTEGSFTCTCKESYFGNGKKCEAGFRPIISTNVTSPVLPNHQFLYSIGRMFCLEGNDTIPPHGATINCTLEETPVPPPKFNMTVIKVFRDNSERLLTPPSEDSILSISASQLSVLFEDGIDILRIVCYVSNTFGSDIMTTDIRICDESECQDGVTNNCTQNCTRTTSIIDGISSYECSCNAGYITNRNDADLCDDFNECANSSYHNCSESDYVTCTNTHGSFLCDCMTGFIMNEETKRCEDINECDSEEISPKCNSSGNENCTNTLGSFNCVCNKGYERDGHSCQNIDECANDTYCAEDKHQLCNDTEGSYYCYCQPGFEEHSDIADNPCQDINECDSPETNNCSQLCNNTIGSYQCFCMEGYIPDLTNESDCNDVDECEAKSNNCHPNANCINNEGSFTCQCKPGYDGDGITDCHLSASLTIGSTLGSLSFALVVAIVGAIACICCFIRRYSKANRKKRFYLARLSDKENEYGKFTTGQRAFSVQSSFKLNLSPHLIIKAANVKLIETIGQGEFGVVYKGHIVKDLGRTVTEVVAIKTLKGFYDRSTIREMLKECSKMHAFEHKHVVTLRGVCLDGGPAPYIIMPFMANGSLLAYLKKNRETLIVSSKEQDEMDSVCKQLADMCVQVAEGMEYLASMKMVHRDLAARNCMIDINFVIKVADFGLSESVGTKEYFRQDKDSCIKLPLKWLAPESMEDGVFSEKSDVWAFGVTCWEIFSVGKNPYPGVNPSDLPKLLADGQRLEKPSNGACHDEMYKFMHQCWELEPENRPTFSSLVKSFSKFLESIAGYVDFSAVGVEHGGLKLETDPAIIINETIIDND